MGPKRRRFVRSIDSTMCGGGVELMRSTLVIPRRRCCPMCDNLGFRKVEADYLGQSVFECNACHYQWAKERGPMEGTKRK